VSVDWSVVYRETYADLVRFLHRKVWDADQAHDLAQETFVRALDHEPENPRAFLFTIAANLARDEARAAVRRKQHLVLLKSETASTQQPVGAAAGVDDAERRERMDLVKQALMQLSEKERDILLLWDAGFSYAEIARQTGLAQGAVGTTLTRARRKLVEAYEGLERQGRRTQQAGQ
jgi:RNA polymerase sigma-70 factor (ECF subfamily)